MNNLKIGARLALLIGCAVAILGVIAFTSLSNFSASHQAFSDVYHGRLIPLEQLKLISDNFGVNIISTAEKVRTGVMGFDEGIVSLNRGKVQIDSLWKQYEKGEANPEELLLRRKTAGLMTTALVSVDTLSAIFRRQDFIEVQQFVRDTLSGSFNPIITSLNDLITFQLRVANGEYRKSDESFISTRRNSIVIIGGGIAILLGIGIIIVRSITAPVNDLAMASTDLKEGKIESRATVIGSDEIAQLATTFNDMAASQEEYIKLVEEGHKTMEASNERLQVHIMTLEEHKRTIDAQNAMIVHITDLVENVHQTQDDMYENLLTTMKAVTKTMAQTLGVERVGLWEYEASLNHLKCVQMYDKDHDQFLQGDIVTENDAPAYLKALKSNRNVVAENVYENLDTRELYENYLEKHDMYALLARPIWGNGRLRAVIACESKTPDKEWKSELVEFISTADSIITIAYGVAGNAKAI